MNERVKKAIEETLDILEGRVGAYTLSLAQTTGDYPWRLAVHQNNRYSNYSFMHKADAIAYAERRNLKKIEIPYGENLKSYLLPKSKKTKKGSIRMKREAYA